MADVDAAGVGGEVPGAEEEDGDAGEGEAEKRGGEAILQAGTGDKEGADRDPVESHDTEAEGGGAGEVEKYGSAPSNGLIAIVCRLGDGFDS